MISRIHQKLGTAGFVISIVALVAALGGGAYAASGALTGKQKKEVEKIAKKYAGKPGAPGATGPAGPAGPTGAKGDTGSTGPEGDQGPEGSPWTAGGTLPAGKTETGAWSFTAPEKTSNNPKIPISFTLPLASPLDGDHVHLVNGAGTKEILYSEETFELEEVTPTACGIALTPAGTAEKPGAAAGNLCVYYTKIEPVVEQSVPGHSETGSQWIFPLSTECDGVGCFPELGGPGAGTSASGARLEIGSVSEAARFGYGSWAVTAGS